MNFTFLVNPVAGGGAGAGAAVPVARLLREAGAVVSVVYPSSAAETAALARAAAERGQVVVAVGGDGMLGLVAGPVSAAGGTLGLLPAGRGNDFARALGLPADPAAQAEVLLAGATRTVDLLAFTGSGSSGSSAAPVLVAGSVYAGLDAEAAAIVARTKRVPRVLQYPLAAVRAVSAYTPAAVRVSVDGTEHHFRAAMVVVANSPYYGGGMRIAPAAELDDGLLDVVVVEASSRIVLVRSLPRLYAGTHVDLPQVSVLRGRRVELSGDPVSVGGDGEDLGVLPGGGAESLAVEVVPRALGVLAPVG